MQKVTSNDFNTSKNPDRKQLKNLFNDWSHMNLKSNHIQALISHMNLVYENDGSSDISHLINDQR
jgi:hypothetical protein